jgi:hypothetical protein
MSIQFQINGDRIEENGESYAADELHEAIWLVNIELRNGLPKQERITAKRQIARYEALLDALRKEGAGA